MAVSADQHDDRPNRRTQPLAAGRRGAATLLLVAGLLAGCTPGLQDPSAVVQPDGTRATVEWKPEEHLDDIAGAAAVLDREAQERWGGEYAGSWIDGGTIWLAFTRDAQAKVAEMKAEVRQPHPVRGVTRSVTLQDLVRLQETMGADRSALQAGEPPRGMPQPIVATQGQYDLDIDLHEGVVSIAVKEVSPELRQAFIDYYRTEALSFLEGISQPDM